MMSQNIVILLEMPKKCYKYKLKIN